MLRALKPRVHMLEMSCNALTDAAAGDVGAFIGNNAESLQALWLEGNAFTSAGARSVRTCAGVLFSTELLQPPGGARVSCFGWA